MPTLPFMPPRGTGAAGIKFYRSGDAQRGGGTPAARERPLRRRWTASELRVAYQPMVGRPVNEICRLRGAAALEPSDSRARSRPTKFIPLAEECGLIGPIGEWVLRTALLEAANWPDNVRVAVNVSPIQFADPALVDHRRALAASGQRRARGTARARDHRRRVPRRKRCRPTTMFAKLKKHRRAARARRFRHRLFVARLFEESAVRQDQDRPELRSRRRVDAATATPRSSARSSRWPKASTWTRPPRASKPMTS